MKTVGIIAEFNPMHTGHKYLIEQAKKITHADTVICIMSGDFTQAGNIAVKDKFKRANIAIENGCDMVIELPTIYATSSAEYFSFGAVNILNALNSIDYLCFGSETADISQLTAIAQKLIQNNKNIWADITENLKTGISFAKAREYAISKFLTKDEIEVSSMSNNILAIEYIKSLIQLNSSIIPVAVPRKENEDIISATKIREKISKGENVDKYVLSSDKVLFSPMLNEKMYNTLKYKIVSDDIKKIRNSNGVTEGLENRLINEINSSKDYEEFVKNVKSKRYELSKIKRILISILLDISKNDFLTLNTKENCYAHVLSINNEKKRELLSLLSKKSDISVITSINEKVLKNLYEPVLSSLMLDIKASNIYSSLSNENINKDYTNKL